MLTFYERWFAGFALWQHSRMALKIVLHFFLLISAWVQGPAGLLAAPAQQPGRGLDGNWGWPPVLLSGGCVPTAGRRVASSENTGADVRCVSFSTTTPWRLRSPAAHLNVVSYTVATVP